MSFKNTLMLSALLLSAQAAQADATLDAQMKALALGSGCLTCHHIESGAKSADGSKPIGPNWQDVAHKYKGQTQALEGSGQRSGHAAQCRGHQPGRCEQAGGLDPEPALSRRPKAQRRPGTNPGRRSTVTFWNAPDRSR